MVSRNLTPALAREVRGILSFFRSTNDPDSEGGTDITAAEMRRIETRSERLRDIMRARIAACERASSSSSSSSRSSRSSSRRSSRRS